MDVADTSPAATLVILRSFPGEPTDTVFSSSATEPAPIATELAAVALEAALDALMDASVALLSATVALEAALDALVEAAVALLSATVALKAALSALIEAAVALLSAAVALDAALSALVEVAVALLSAAVALEAALSALVEAAVALLSAAVALEDALSALVDASVALLRGIENNLPCCLVTKLRLSLLPDTTNIKLDFDNMFHRKVYSNHFVADHLGFKNTAIIKPLPGKNAADFTADEWILVPAQLNVFKELMSPATFKSEWPYIITALASLISSQRLYAITTNGAASTETYSDIRKRLIKFGYVECVVQLPENLIPGTSIPTTLWIFSKNNKTVRFIDASEIKTKGRRKFSLSDKDIKAIVALITKPEFTESNHSHKSQKGRIKVVHNDELAASNYNLAPSRYIQEDFPSDSSGFILLEEVCQINRGVLLKAQELDTLVADNNSVKYITPKNLNNSIIDLSGVTSLAETDEISPKKAISDNNIIMSKLLPFKAGYITDTQNNMIFSNGNTYYLQVDKKAINPLFLFMYLNSKMAQKQLEQLSRGSSTTTLSISDLKNLKIPLIKRSIQNELSEKYQELLAKEQRIYESLKALERDKDRLIEDALQ